ncbi:TPA: phosphoribosylformylglycinamidine synthase subunit PurL, partial [Candidatus Bathyarchaeota archaeon]|nr:phosphoribosylformylglycinamidine synthase subunit PurL [Candidatus Bathyarchaeota archaeon]
GVAAAEMAFAGDLGMEIYLKNVPTLNLDRNDKILFSESNSRILVEVPGSKEEEFKKVMAGATFAKIGRIIKEKNFVVYGLSEEVIVEEKIAELRNVWKSVFNWWGA